MDVGRTRSIRAGRTAALLTAAALCGCIGNPAPGDSPGAGDQRTPTGVAGKPLVQTPTGLVVADELVASFVPAVSRDEVEEAVAALGGEVIFQGSRTGVYVIRFADADSALAALPALREQAGALEVRRSHVARGTGVGTSPSLMDLQWNLWGLQLDPNEDPGDATGVLVSVLDTGVAYETYSDSTGTYALAPDLSGTSFVSGWDFVDGDAHPNDANGHGTHVTGVIAASSGITPLAGGADIMPVRVLDDGNMGTEVALAEGILYAADSGADVINMSLSFSPAYFPSRFLQDAVNRAADEGVTMVAAVGNHGADGVPFPAAFRDVIAVGASRVSSGFRSEGGWRALGSHGLAPTSYSNRGFLVDVTAPGGVVDQDVDGDGNPEAIVAQSFRGDPTQFEYLLFAGTSQAAAQVSALAARALHEDESVSPFEVRALFGETTQRSAGRRAVLDEQIGRGYVSGRRSMRSLDTPLALRERHRFSAFVQLSFSDSGGGDGGGHWHGHHYGWYHHFAHRGWGWGHDGWGWDDGDDEPGGPVARAEVQVFDEDHQPASRVWVYGTFTGGIHEPVIGRTDRSGHLVLSSSALQVDTRVIGFQVDAVATADRRTVDRPRGAIRIDSCSLERLSRYADSLAGATPITASDGAGVQSLQLLNFSSGLATVPMAVAVDRDWFYGTFAGAEAGTVVLSGQSLSVGDDVGPGDSDGPCVDLLLQTFSTLDETVAPLAPDPDGSCSQDDSCFTVQSLLEAFWQGEAPGYDASLGISADLYDHLAQVVAAYAGFQSQPTAAAVGVYDDVLTAAGVGLVPYDGPQSDGAGVTSMSQ